MLKLPAIFVTFLFHQLLFKNNPTSSTRGKIAAADDLLSISKAQHSHEKQIRTLFKYRPVLLINKATNLHVRRLSYHYKGRPVLLISKVTPWATKLIR